MMGVHIGRTTMQSVIGAMFLGVFLGVVLVFAGQHDFKHDNRSQISEAIHACEANIAYTPELQGQCIGDYFDMRGW